MGKIVNIGGHRCENTGRKEKALPGKPHIFRCLDCEMEGDSMLFSVPIDGCPGNPASLELSVCPGGERCAGHVVTDSAEWRAYKESNHISLTTVPRRKCSTDGLADRAADQYKRFADRVGIKFDTWNSLGYEVGPEGGTVAEMSFQGKPWRVVVDRYGKITAERMI